MSIRNYGLITSVDELADYAHTVYGNVFGFDIETGYHGPDREKGSVHPETAMLAGISFTASQDFARYVPLGHKDAENLNNAHAAAIFWDLLNTGLGVAHNAAFELRHLSRWFREHLSTDPIRGEAVRATRGYFPIRSDTLVEAYLMAEYERFGLKPLTKNLFDHTMTELHELFPGLEKNKRKYLRFDILPLDPHVVDYACEDSVWCLAIHERYYPQVKDRLLYGVEKAIVQDVVPPMEDEGVVYDWPLMKRTADELRLFRDRFNAEIMAELSEMIGRPIAVNLASPPQVGQVLYGDLGYATDVYTDKTRDLPPGERKMSTGKIALERLAQQHPVVQKIREWKKMTRLLGTYLDKYEKQYSYAADGRAHPSHLSAFVITGRFAHTDPPYAQSPKKYHFDLAEAKAAHEAGETPPPGTCFKFNFRDVITVPPEHYGLGFDLSQAELRAIAGEAQETALLEAFANGDDVHRLTASLMLGVPLDEVTEEQRNIGKTMNFALLYGMSVKGLADRLGIPVDEAQALMDKYFAGLPNIATYMAKMVEHGKNYGYVVSKFGRKLPIWEYQSEFRSVRAKGDRACVNYPIQGAATGDYMKIAMVRAVAAIKQAGLSDKIKLVMNIHDALEFYVHRSVEPSLAISILAPAVVFEVPDWPPMKADWHLFRRWGSPTNIEVSDTFEISVKGEKPADLDPVLEEDEDGDTVEVLPEIDADTIRAAARTEHGRQVIMTIRTMPDAASWKQFMDMARSSPGNNTVTVVTPQGELVLPFTCNLRPDHLGQAVRLLGDPELSLVYRSDAENLTAGLAL